MIKRVSIHRFFAMMLLGLVFSSTSAFAQLDEIKAFLESGPANATKLAQAYIAPLPTGISTGLNSGWTNKAAPTKKLGFSVQFRIAAATVPSSAQSFDASTLGLENVVVTGSSSNSIAGSKGAGQTIYGPDNPVTNEPIYSFQVPGGVGASIVPLPMIQGNVGLIKGTDVTLRYVPEVSGDAGDVSLFGVGIKHGLNQWLPGGKLLPVDISLMAAFSQLSLNGVIDKAKDQVVETSTNTFVLNALVGKTLPFVSAYAGVGIQTGKFELDMLGAYDLDNDGTAEFTDPVSFTQDSDAAIQALAGVQFKLAIFRIYGEVTAAEYTTYNVGIGIGLRN